MPFLDLPPEVVDEILSAAVQVRTLERAVRLRHVSRSWDVAVVRAIFESGVLDGNKEAYKYWPRYLAYRTSRAGRRNGWPRPLLVLRRVAERLLTWRGDDGLSENALVDCIGDFCALMMPQFDCGLSEIAKEGPGYPTEGDDETLLLHALMAIAAARNDVPLIKHLLKDVNDRPCQLFQNPLDIAASKGYIEIVRLLLDVLRSDSSDASAIDRARHSVFLSACRGGQISTLEMVLEPREEGDTKWDQNLYYGMKRVTDVEVFKRLYSSAKGFLHAEELRHEPHQRRYWPTSVLPNFLWLAALRGAIPLMEFLIELGATPETEHTWSKVPSERLPVEAARGHGEAVVYLLEKGVSSTRPPPQGRDVRKSTHGRSPSLLCRQGVPAPGRDLGRGPEIGR
ncbi:hypothetical protein PG993_008874 [Apiospora rasikravindrae]|uniref:F-box domain-containing protein n=1 Tax=Apiospora rasikravindrae TaxID=990691 RepID=A0ABR1SRB2_9PEZI